MKVLIQQARIIDPSSPQHDQIQDILIDSGKIVKIAPRIDDPADHLINEEGICISPGWLDIFSHFNDPGYEQKETLETGSRAAAAGGFTHVMLLPNTKPVVDNKSLVEYIVTKSQQLDVTLLPIGAISKNTEGRELAEMYDMKASGAIAFSDGNRPVQSSGLLLKALQYIKAFNGVIIQIPDDQTIGTSGLVHEGIISTQLGLPGKPMMAEELMVARDIKLARYAESKLHFTGISSPRSLEYIRRAKEAGLSVTCSVTPHHLYFSDSDLSSYDTNLKVYPPLRTSTEIAALKAAIIDGTVDCIASHHLPQESDSKNLEFEYARFGCIGLETVYPALKTAMPEVSEERWVTLLSINPRKIFGLDSISIQEGKTACLSIFKPGGTTLLQASQLYSRSGNSPFLNLPLKGSVCGIINGERLFLK